MIHVLVLRLGLAWSKAKNTSLEQNLNGKDQLLTGGSWRSAIGLYWPHYCLPICSVNSATPSPRKVYPSFDRAVAQPGT